VAKSREARLRSIERGLTAHLRYLRQYDRAEHDALAGMLRRVVERQSLQAWPEISARQPVTSGPARSRRDLAGTSVTDLFVVFCELAVIAHEGTFYPPGS
jgi:hypothetical protein